MILIEATIPGAANNPRRISNQSIALTNFWEPLVTEFNPPQFRIAKSYGGYSQLSFGGISFNIEMFDDDATWPPPRTVALVFKHTTTTQEAAIELFRATGYLSSFGLSQVQYDLFGTQHTEKSLDTTTNFNNETDIPVPMVLGHVDYVVPLRVPDVNTAPTYHKAGITSNFMVFDDGVDITANATTNADGTFSLSAVPVGEVTMSGDSTINSIDALLSWGAGRLSLSYTNTNIGTSIPINAYVVQQGLVVDLLSEVSSFACKLFYIANGNELVAVGMSENNGTPIPLNTFQFQSSDIVYEKPIKQINTSWEVPTAGEQRDGGKLVRREVVDLSVESEYTYGQEINVESFYQFGTNIKATNEARLNAILELIHTPRLNLRYPLSEGLPLPGQQISITDTNKIRQITTLIRARNLQYDFRSEFVIVGGEGTLT